MTAARASVEPHVTALPRALGRLRVAMDAIYTQTSRELGLTAQQAELLCAALRPAAVGDIARVLRCDRTNVTRLVDRAAGRGLVRRRRGDTDGRVTVIELNPEGRRLAEQFIANLESRASSLLAHWPRERQEATAATLHALAEALDRDADSDKTSQARAAIP
jgi:DNA-binding MarR family transcriptional regulator